jgi:LuxR family maltose regulon positive regulatory protein
LFARLRAGATLALDNYQEVSAGHKLHELIAQAVTEVPQGITLIVISRRDPPDCYARLIANENVTFVDWEDLKLTLEEARCIAADRAQLDEQTLLTLYSRSEGWAAGLTLLIEGSDARSGTHSSQSHTGREALFKYFATQIFKAVSEDTRHFLMATAHLSKISVSVASELAGKSRSTEILEDMYRRHLFTHRREARERTYGYHALFREFLIEQARHLWSDAQRRDLQIHLASLLMDRGEHEEAFSLLHQSQWTTQALPRLPLGPPPRIARSMNYRQDMNEIVANREEDTIWESRKERATNARGNLGVQQRSLLKAFELQFDRGQELFAKARALRFVPLARLANFTQGSSRKL